VVVVAVVAIVSFPFESNCCDVMEASGECSDLSHAQHLSMHTNGSNAKHSGMNFCPVMWLSLR
jgi:hypothetical protein